MLHIQPLKMEQIEGSETSANHNQTPGKYPKEYRQDSKHGESLKSRINSCFLRSHILHKDTAPPLIFYGYEIWFIIFGCILT